jgi:hypothetical protein
MVEIWAWRALRVDDRANVGGGQSGKVPPLPMSIATAGGAPGVMKIKLDENLPFGLVEPSTERDSDCVNFRRL